MALGRLRGLSRLSALDALSIGRDGRERLVETAFSPLKAKLESGQNAVIFINADSTGYSDYGPFYKLAVALGNLHDYTVSLYRWAEWEGSAATGPKQYSAPATIRTGTRGTLTVYLAALPGQVAGAMFDGARRANAIDAIPTPDLCIMHHGHNMQTFNVPYGTQYAVGRGALLGPIGMTSLKWPNAPQVITSQNPWRDTAGYDKVYGSIVGVNAALPSLTLVNSYALFLAAGKAAGLYRDNIHPSDTSVNSSGAQLVADALLSAYRGTKPGAFTTTSWPARALPNIITNGNFSDWSGSVPAGWALTSGATVAKDTTYTYGGAAYSCAISPNGNSDARISFTLGTPALNLIAGKTVSYAVLCRQPSAQVRPYFSLSIRSGGQTSAFVTGDLINCKDGWMWLCASGIPVDADIASFPTQILRLYPSFGVTPSVNDPLIVQRALLTVGDLPAGMTGA